MEIGGVQVVRECPNPDCNYGRVQVDTSVSTAEFERPTGNDDGARHVSCRTCRGGGKILTKNGTYLKAFVEEYCDV